MASYSLTFARSARKELEKLPASAVERIVSHLESLMRTPRPPQSKKLVGRRDLWRLRVGDYRIIYSIDDAARVIDISAVRHRRDL